MVKILATIKDKRKKKTATKAKRVLSLLLLYFFFFLLIVSSYYLLLCLVSSCFYCVEDERKIWQRSRRVRQCSIGVVLRLGPHKLYPLGHARHCVWCERHIDAHSLLSQVLKF